MDLQIMRTQFKSAGLQCVRFLQAGQGDNRKDTENFSVLKFGSQTRARTRDLRINSSKRNGFTELVQTEN